MMRDEKGDDEKILCVPKNDPLWNHIRSLEDVPPHLLREIEHFFAIYKDLEHKEVTIEGWRDKEAALELIRETEARFKEKGLGKPDRKRFRFNSQGKRPQR